jgi:uncharacterized protein YabE (DUF348 family)
MKKIPWLLLAVLLILSACQSSGATTVTFLDGGTICQRSTSSRDPASLLAGCDITLGPDDRLLYLGASIPLDSPIAETTPLTLTIRRAVVLTILAPDGTRTLQTSAFTVGQALSEAGVALYAADRIDPPAETPIAGPLTVTYQPSREIVITVDGSQVRARSAADTVGQALAEAGLPLVGLDASTPDEAASLPADGQIRVVRVVETVTLTQKAIPFNSRSELSADLEIDQQALVQGGEPGLAVARLRTRSEDGVQVSQQSESESIVRPPQDRILGIGTKIVIRTATVDGVTIEYWRALNLYATAYSPCRSMTPSGACSYGTSSGLRAGKGVVAMVYPWYILFGFEHVYVPGYGQAVIGDVGGIGGHYWIDLGYDDDNFVGWSQMVTVYFLTPVPANPGYILP